ncbi:Alpha-2B adrenergic receptor [Toxocara canis]|uniref:Alpha-2B adrenergic receptor n=1 Tax=Toxocara canis TaxID=6265 RepID=A0A0B2UXI1_TOXCA|nr:Alpha-2B adrenergic receptor [Toxocara canis]
MAATFDDDNSTAFDAARAPLQPLSGEWRSGYFLLILLIAMIVFGNSLVVLAVVCDRKLRTITTNKFIASLAVSDLLVGIVVMPLSLYAKVLSSILSFFLPGAIVVYLYVKIFRKLRNHQLFTFGQTGLLKRRKSRHADANERRRSLPRVIIEEVRSRRGSRLSQTGSNSETPTRRSSASGSHKSERSPSQPEIHNVAVVQKRWRSPTICAETLEHDRSMAAKKRVSIVPDPPSMDVSQNSYAMSMAIREEHLANQIAAVDQVYANESMLMLPATTTPASRRQSVDVEIGIPRKSSGNVTRRYSVDRNMIGRKLSIEDIEQSCGKSLPQPIIAAFNKAYEEIAKSGDRSRRPSLIKEIDEPVSRTLIKTQLSTVVDESEAGSTENAIVETPLTDSETVSKRPLLLSAAREKPKPLDCLRVNSFRNRVAERAALPSFLMVPTSVSISTPPLSPTSNTREITPTSLTVPKLWDCPSPTNASAPSSGNSSHSSYTSASGSDETYRRISMNSYGSSLTDGTDSTYEIDSRRSSAWSTLRTAVLAHHFVSDAHTGSAGQSVIKPKCSTVTIMSPNGSYSPKKMSTISRGKLRKIATQVTRAIRRKRRESIAIRRESRATRVVAAILIAFLICWIPYFCVTVYRGICTGLQLAFDKQFHVHLFVVSSWLGYAHSCFNPVIYTCLNKNFRRTMRKMICFWRGKRTKLDGQ